MIGTKGTGLITTPGWTRRRARERSLTALAIHAGPIGSTMPGVPPILKDRRSAGSLLADRLSDLAGERPIILALPRGGVPVGLEIARKLRAPLDVMIVRKIGAPDNPEYGLGAMVEDGTYTLDERRLRETGYARTDIEGIVRRERAETERRCAVYRAVCPRTDRRGRTVVLVDDGAATGGTLFSAIGAARADGARRVVAALGVAPPETCRELEKRADRVAVLLQPEAFFAVGQFYERFDPVEDDEVLSLLRAASDIARP